MKLNGQIGANFRPVAELAEEEPDLEAESAKRRGMIRNVQDLACKLMPAIHLLALQV